MEEKNKSREKYLGHPGKVPSKFPVILAKRPGRGTRGQHMSVLANHYRVKFEPRILYHYDVVITPEPPKGQNRAVLDAVFKLHGRQKLQNVTPAYDGQKSLYTARSISDHVELEVELPELDEAGIRRRNRNFKVVLREASQPDLRQLADFLAGKIATVPQEALQALDIVLRAAAVKYFTPRGKSFFGSHFGVRSLGGGVEAWNGFYQSIRPAQNGLLTLNLDIAAAPFIEQDLLPDFLGKAFGMDPRDLDCVLARPDAQGDTARARVKRLLRGIRVETTHTRGAKRVYRLQNISSQPLSQLSFDLNGEEVSIVEYFKRTYGYRIILQGLPAIDAGSKDKKKYLPMELCRIRQGQPYTKVMSDVQKNSLLTATCVPPRERMGQTEQIAKDLIQSTYSIADEFGLRVNRLLTEIPARVLPAPKIMYQSMEECPREGAWNMRGKVMYQGCKITAWSLVNFSRTLPDRAVDTFCSRLPVDCETYGIQMNPKMAAPWITEINGNIENAVKHLCRLCKQQTGQDLQLIICIMPQTENKPIYASVKRMCEIELGLLTQCCLSDHIKRCNPQYIANVILKINAKLGGYNALLLDEMQKRLPLISDVPSIIIGADVSHPKIGDVQSPSICAVVASMDWPYFSRYESIVRSQCQRSEVLEELFWEREDENGQKQAGGIIKDLLHSFAQRSGYRPQRILYYRDGVSDGQFDAVLQYEFDAVKKACMALGWGFWPTQEDGLPAQKRARSTPELTFVVVQKQHHTRFFPGGGSPTTKSGNIIPGTVVDSVICHPNQFDFFLCSHVGIKGTSKPAHYHVLKDEIGFSTDQIQQLTNDLCFTYVRCTRAVSIVPPCYYAHLAATRARLWIESDDLSDSGSHPGRASTVDSGGRSSQVRPLPLVRPLPELHHHIKQTMFYI